jgi:hypothetical protein
MSTYLKARTNVSGTPTKWVLMDGVCYVRWMPPVQTLPAVNELDRTKEKMTFLA